MEDKQGFVLFYRKIHEWDWYTDSFTFHLFFHCITSANHKTKKWRGIEIKRGQFLTGRKKLSVETGLSEQQVRTCLKRLKSTNELTIESTNSYSIITVNNYDLYQPILKNQPTKTQSNNQHLTTTNNDNNISNISYINISLSDKKITNDEREILKNYILRQKRKPDNIDAYMKAIIKNGDWVSIVETEKKRLQIKEEKKKKQEELKQEIIKEDNLTPEEEALKIAEIQKKIRENRLKRRKN